MKQVSVVIPVYNSEQYLHDCLESVCRQTYQNLDIVCEYDASTDNSLAILKACAARDDRIKIVVNDGAVNSPAHGRNIGLDAATGDFIRFVDSDDVIPLDSTAILVECITSGNHEAARGTFDYAAEDLRSTFSEVRLTDTRAPGRVPRDLPYDVCAGLLCGHFAYLFDLTVLRSWGCRYAYEIRVGEDALFLQNIFFKMRSLCLTPELVYHYRVRPDSAMTGCKAFSWFSDILHTFQNFYKISSANGALPIADYYFLQSVPHYLWNEVLASLPGSLTPDEQDRIFRLLREIMTENTIFSRLKQAGIGKLGVNLEGEDLLFLFCIWLEDFDRARKLLQTPRGWVRQALESGGAV